MPTLDLLSQVLFVALMAMFLYVLYRRFVAMLMKGRITGDYARIVWCKHAEGDRVAVRVDVPAEATCHVRWEGGDPVQLTLSRGEQTVEFAIPGPKPDRIQFDFGNQQVVRRLEA